VGQRGDAQRGDSLIELLVSIGLLGIMVTAMMGAVFVTVASARMLRTEVAPANNVGLIMGNWADSITMSGYVQCESGSALAARNSPGAGWAWDGSKWTKGSGADLLTAQVTNMTYWDLGSDTVAPAFSSTCPAGGDTGVQSMKLVVTAPANSTYGDMQDLMLVKRNPCSAVDVAAKVAGC